MGTAHRVEDWTAASFLATGQAAFGPLWRYELVDGRIVGHAAPAPEHGAILAGLSVALGGRMAGRKDGCRPELGSGAAAKRQQRANARIADTMIRCGGLPRVLFEVVSPSELRAWRQRDDRRTQLQDVADVQEIVELYQEQMAARLYRRGNDGVWTFETLGGEDATLHLASMDLSLPLREICQFADLTQREA